MVVAQPRYFLKRAVPINKHYLKAIFLPKFLNGTQLINKFYSTEVYKVIVSKCGTTSNRFVTFKTRSISYFNYFT